MEKKVSYEELEQKVAELERKVVELNRCKMDLLQSEERFASIINNCPAVIYIKDAQGRYLLLNRHALDLRNIREEEIIGRTDDDIFPSDVAAALKANDQIILESKIPFEKEEQVEIGGRTRIYLTMKFPICNSDGIPIEVGGISTDITERKQTEEQLLQSKEMLQTVFDGILDPLILLGRNMETKLINRAAANYYGAAFPYEAVGKACYRAFRGRSEPCKECEIPLAFVIGQNKTFERKGLINPDKFEKVCIYILKDKEGEPTEVIIRTSDITERKLYERQLIQNGKMASLGLLVSSIAHEINNPNNFISFNIPILREYLHEMMPIIDNYATGCADFELCHLTYPELRQDIFKLLENIENGSDRISFFVSNLRGLSQNQDKKPQQLVDLKDVIERVLAICHSKIKNSVKSFVQSVPEDLPKIYTPPYALEQILINLLMNAVQATDKKDSWIRLNITVNAGEPYQIVIEVSDNGCGVDGEIRDKIFDPFFSTKSRPEGTGLGLYACHKLVEALRGRIEVESEPGRGSIFKVILSVTEQNYKKDYS